MYLVAASIHRLALYKKIWLQQLLLWQLNFREILNLPHSFYKCGHPCLLFVCCLFVCCLFVEAIFYRQILNTSSPLQQVGFKLFMLCFLCVKEKYAMLFFILLTTKVSSPKY